MSITVSLASHVLSLSTGAFYGHPVSSSGAFFGEWRFSRRILLLVLLSFACLASSSLPLRSYAIFPNNYVRLASICRPHSLASVALTTFRSIPGQSFAFVCNSGNRTHSLSFDNTIALPLCNIANLLRCAAPVAPYLVRYRIQHTDCLSSCGLLNVFSSIRGLTLPLSRCYHAFACGLRLCSYLLTFSIR